METPKNKVNAIGLKYLLSRKFTSDNFFPKFTTEYPRSIERP